MLDDVIDWVRGHRTFPTEFINFMLASASQ